MLFVYILNTSLTVVLYVLLVRFVASVCVCVHATCPVMKTADHQACIVELAQCVEKWDKCSYCMIVATVVERRSGICWWLFTNAVYSFGIVGTSGPWCLLFWQQLLRQLTIRMVLTCALWTMSTKFLAHVDSFFLLFLIFHQIWHFTGEQVENFCARFRNWIHGIYCTK